jgi:hypothetical protein
MPGSTEDKPGAWRGKKRSNHFAHATAAQLKAAAAATALLSQRFQVPFSLCIVTHTMDREQVRIYVIQLF